MTTAPQSLSASYERAVALLVALRESRTDIERLLTNISPQDLALPTICVGWSVRDEIGHIIDATETVVKCLEQAEAGVTEGTSQPKAMAPAMQTSAMSRAALLPLPQLRQEFGNAAVRLLTLLDERDPNSWDDAVPHPYLGSCSAVQIAGMALLDWFIHPWDIRKAIGQEPVIRHDHALLVLTGFINMMPRRLDPSRARNARARFRFIIEQEKNPEQVLAQIDIVMARNQASIERDAAADLPTELTLKGSASALILGLLGRAGFSKLAQPAPTNDTWLARWPNLWISL